MITQEEIDRLKSAKNDGEWAAFCATIRQSRGGVYPSGWGPFIAALYAEVSASWKS